MVQVVSFLIIELNFDSFGLLLKVSDVNFPKNDISIKNENDSKLFIL